MDIKWTERFGEQLSSSLPVLPVFFLSNFYTLLSIRWPVGIIDYWLCGFDWWYVLRTGRVFRGHLELGAHGTLSVFCCDRSKAVHLPKDRSNDAWSRFEQCWTVFYWTAQDVFTSVVVLFAWGTKAFLAKLLCQQRERERKLILPLNNKQ